MTPRNPLSSILNSAHLGLDVPSNVFRHVVRIEGSDAAVDALLHHVTEGDDGYWCSDAEFASALAYIDDLPAVLEFEPHFYVPARFAIFPYVVLRGSRSATIVIHAMQAQIELCRFLAAFHPDVYLVVLAGEEGGGMWTGSFLNGIVREPWRNVPIWESDASPLLGLSCPEWLRDEHRTRDNFRDVGFPSARTQAGHIRVRGASQDVQQFRKELLTCTEPDFASVSTIDEVMRMATLRPHSGCVLDDWDHDDLVVRFRFDHGLRGVARRWSRAFPGLECDVVVTNRQRERCHTRFVDGKEVACAAIVVDEREFDDAFDDDRYRRSRR